MASESCEGNAHPGAVRCTSAEGNRLWTDGPKWPVNAYAIVKEYSWKSILIRNSTTASMRTHFTFLLGIYSLGLCGQAVLHSNEMLPFGSTMELWYAGNGSIVVDTSLQTGNATWNFSALNHAPNLEPDLVVNVVSPTSTPYASTFPSANYAWAESNGAYRYFNLSNTSLQRVGSRTYTNNIYINPQTELVYPLQLGTQNLDTWSNTLSSTGGTYRLHCVGTGTLVLPSATWQDALMVRVVVTEGPYKYLGFFWYSSQNGAVLVQQIGELWSDGSWEPSTFYLNSLSVGIEEQPALQLLSWQNPVSDELWLETNSKHGGQQPWNLFGPTGQLLASGLFSTTPGGRDRLSVPMANYAPGMYLLRIGEGNNTVPLKVVKQ